MRNSVFAVIYNAKNIGMAFETSLHYAKHYLTDTTGLHFVFSILSSTFTDPFMPRNETIVNCLHAFYFGLLHNFSAR